MKLIKAYIRYRKIDQVYKTLVEAGFRSMTFVECEGTGKYADHEEDHISSNYPFANSYRVIKLENRIRDDQVDQVIEIVRKSGRTGYQGDGMILVSPVEEVYKIRTNEKGIAVV